MPFARVMFLIAAVTLASGLLSAQSVDITEYSGVAGATAITAGPDGAMWFVENIGKIGRISTSGAITEFALSNPQAGPRAITAGPDGALWFTEGSATGNKIGRITTTGTITEFAIPTASASPFGITTGPDGALWFTESSGSNSKIGRITTAGAISEFSLPSPNRGPNFITAGPDGALWFTEYWGNKIGRITTAGAVTEYDIPTPNSGAFGIAAGPDGALWFTEQTANKIGRITTAGVITEYSVPTSGAAPLGIATGPDGALWFTEPNKIGRITTAGAITQFVLPTSGTPYQIAVGPDGALWYDNTTRIGRAQLPQSRSGAFSHLAAGAGWTTVITLVNTSPVPVPLTVVLRDGLGGTMTLPLTVTQRGVSQNITGSSVAATISPNATLLISMGDRLTALQTGWAEVLSTGPVGGFAIFRTSQPGGMASEGTVPLQTQFPYALTLPFDNTAGYVMGVALANLSGASATIAVTVWDESGAQLDAPAITIPGNGHTAFELPREVPLSGGKRGIVRFQSSGMSGLSGLGLRFSPYLTFTSVPVIQ